MNEMEMQPATHGADRELAEAVIHYGDEGAFRDLYRRHTPRLLGFVSRLLGGSEPDAEDAVQETWIRVCRNLGKFRWESTLSTWLLGIGLNVVKDHMRRRGRSRLFAVDELPETPVAPRSHEDRIDLERAIELLPGGYRWVLVLHDVEGMKHREIAEALGIAEGTSKSQLAHARKMLRNTLSPPKGGRP